MDKIIEDQIMTMRDKGLNDRQITASSIDGGFDGSAIDTAYYDLHTTEEKKEQILGYAQNFFGFSMTEQDINLIFDYLEGEFSGSNARHHAFESL